MQELAKNKLFLIVAGFMIVNLFAFFGSQIIIDRTATKVIERLQKEYSPSPYGPGIDVDKMHPATQLQQQLVADDADKTFLELRQAENGQEAIQFAPTLEQMTQQSMVWRDDWEKERGFSVQH